MNDFHLLKIFFSPSFGFQGNQFACPKYVLFFSGASAQGQMAGLANSVPQTCVPFLSPCLVGRFGSPTKIGKTAKRGYPNLQPLKSGGPGWNSPFLGEGRDQRDQRKIILGGGSPTKIDVVNKCWYPYSNLPLYWRT